MRLPFPALSAFQWVRYLLGLLLLGGLGQLPAQAQIHYLDLSEQQIVVPDRVFYVEQVLDGRANQAMPLGTVYQGLNNRPAAVFFRQGLTAELTRWFQQQIPQQPHDQAIVLCVRQLRVNEVIGNWNEKAKADLAMDVYAHWPDGYHFVQSVAHLTTRQALDATHRHAPQVVETLKMCLFQLANVDWAQTSQPPALTLAQLLAHNPLRTARPAIWRTSTPRKGIYRSFEQFLNNQPDTTFRLRLDTLHLTTKGWEGTTLFRSPYRSINDHTDSPQVWGFSDGRQTYLRQDRTFYLLNRQGDGYTFVGPAPRDMKAAGQRAQTYAMQGALGAALNPVEDHTGQPTAFALDIRTGQVGAFPPPGQPQRTDTAFVYVYRPAGGPAAPQRLLLDGREMGQLRPGEYLELTYPRFGHIMRLSDGTVSGPVLLLVPNAAADNYVKLLNHARGTQWQLMPTRQGATEVDALEKQHK